ncbi:uncharacterized protein LOC122015099 isoform X1 [Zingiber officinale]|uniref:ARM repeat superfamily protein n=2 Tax=Zingiber officinale TaxID=94328 RepID=A0A8J5F5L5_ZINOF|nr:uncharacterized protein LOC122015099 isoform X1 [Zingiber officinale]KAG6481328.1 hypothetical protein ZIOFF_057925 [Zingiber officinale]
MAPVPEQEGLGLGDTARRSEDDAEEAEDDADEEKEEAVEADANAPSHLPLAPHPDSEILDATTTVDPSYIIFLIRQLLPYDSNVEKQSKVADSDMQKNLGKGESNVELDDRKPSTEDTREPQEDCGCILWDLAATESHAELMVQNLILEVLVTSLHASRSFRLKEICLGIIGNLACHKNLSSTIVSTNGLIQIIVDQLFQDDSVCLSETFRLLSVSLQSSSSVTWAEALLHDQILLRILWIIGNTLNMTLLEKSIEFLLTIIQHEEVEAVLLQPLVKFGLPNLVLSLLESEFNQLKENKLERLAVFDLVLQVVEALSTADNCFDLITSNNHIFHLACEVVKLSHKIEVDSLCASAVVILANILVDQRNLVLSIANDFQFLQGLLDALPFVSIDSTARSALWSILQRVLCLTEGNDDGSLDLHRLTLLLLDKHFLIVNDIDSHASDDFGGDEGKEFVIASGKRIASILEKWKERDPSSTENYDGKAQKLLDCCRKSCF